MLLVKLPSYNTSETDGDPASESSDLEKSDNTLNRIIAHEAASAG